jgi:hypothetical protein
MYSENKIRFPEGPRFTFFVTTASNSALRPTEFLYNMYWGQGDLNVIQNTYTHLVPKYDSPLRPHIGSLHHVVLRHGGPYLLLSSNANSISSKSSSRYGMISYYVTT